MFKILPCSVSDKCSNASVFVAKPWNLCTFARLVPIIDVMASLVCVLLVLVRRLTDHSCSRLYLKDPTQMLSIAWLRLTSLNRPSVASQPIR
jgi:cell division inhibitor SulA